MRVARPVVLNPEQKESLEECARARTRPARVVERARIVLLAAAGKQDREIAASLNITAHKAARKAAKAAHVARQELTQLTKQVAALKKQLEKSTKRLKSALK